MIGGALGCGVGRPWFLKRHVHEFVRSSGWGRCAATTPGEPASAWHIAGRYSEIPRDLNSVPEDKWEPTAALSAARKDLVWGQGKQNSHRVPPRKGFCLLLLRVTQRHAWLFVTLKWNPELNFWYVNSKQRWVHFFSLEILPPSRFVHLFYYE